MNGNKFQGEHDIVERFVHLLGYTQFSLADPNAGQKTDTGVDVLLTLDGRRYGIRFKCSSIWPFGGGRVGLSRAIERDRAGALACLRSRLDHQPQKSVFRSSVSRREKQSTSGLAEGLVNPGSSTDRNPDRSIDDGIGASAATDTLPGAGNNGSAGSPRGSNRVSGQPGQCRRESLHLPWIGWVPKQSD